MKFKELLSKAESQESYNTNNDWGFGGGIGTMYKFKNGFIKKGTAYYRHAPSEKYVTVWIDGRREKDVSGTTIKGDLSKLYKALTD